MVKQLEMPIQIIGCPIMREPNGLAMSSRNERLTKQERELGSLIYKTLSKIQNSYTGKTVAELKALGESEIKSEPQMKLEYIEISDSATLQPISDLKQSKSVVVCIALKLGAVRLIDNVLLY